MYMADLREHSPNQPTELDIDQLTPGKLYAVLDYCDELTSWDWGFFVPDPASSPIGSSGTIFHAVYNKATKEWKLEVKTRNVLSDPPAVAIVMLADVTFFGGYHEQVGQDSLLPILKLAPIPTKGTFSSRAWFVDAISPLHDCDVLQCDDVWLLEREIQRCAFKAMERYMECRGECLSPFFF